MQCFEERCAAPALQASFAVEAAVGPDAEIGGAVVDGYDYGLLGSEFGLGSAVDGHVRFARRRFAAGEVREVEGWAVEGCHLDGDFGADAFCDCQYHTFNS